MMKIIICLFLSISLNANTLPTGELELIKPKVSENINFGILKVIKPNDRTLFYLVGFNFRDEINFDSHNIIGSPEGYTRDDLEKIRREMKATTIAVPTILAAGVGGIIYFLSKSIKATGIAAAVTFIAPEISGGLIHHQFDIGNILLQKNALPQDKISFLDLKSIAKFLEDYSFNN